MWTKAFIHSFGVFCNNLLGIGVEKRDNLRELRLDYIALLDASALS